jgi:hypothetical protein
VVDDISGQSVEIASGRSNEPVRVSVNSEVRVGGRVGSGSNPVFVSVKTGILVEVELVFGEPVR